MLYVVTTYATYNAPVSVKQLLIPTHFLQTSVTTFITREKALLSHPSYGWGSMLINVLHQCFICGPVTVKPYSTAMTLYDRY